MPDMRRHGPEPPPGPPQIQLKPGLANEMLRDLAPLLAEEGIDVDNIDVPDLDTLQAAMNRAVERHNMARFTPVGQARDLAVATLRLAVEAIADGDTVLAAAVLDQVAAESPDNSAATVASCIGVALGLLDDWLSGGDPSQDLDPLVRGSHMAKQTDAAGGAAAAGVANNSFAFNAAVAARLEPRKLRRVVFMGLLRS